MLDIQKHGRWKSLTVFSYVGTTAAEQLAVTRSFLGEAKAAGVDAVAGAGAVIVKVDEIPSPQAHALKAAAVRGKVKAVAAAAAGKGGPRKRSLPQSSEGDEDEDEEETEVHHLLDAEDDAVFLAAMEQGWREEDAAAARPVRAAKEAAKKAVEKLKPAPKKSRK